MRLCHHLYSVMSDIWARSYSFHDWRLPAVTAVAHSDCCFFAPCPNILTYLLACLLVQLVSQALLWQLKSETHFLCSMFLHFFSHEETYVHCAQSCISDLGATSARFRDVLDFGFSQLVNNALKLRIRPLVDTFLSTNHNISEVSGRSYFVTVTVIILL